MAGSISNPSRAVSIRVRDNGTFMWLKGMPKRARKIGNRGAYNLARRGAKLIKESAREAGIKHFDKVLLTENGIRAVKIKLGEYGIEMPLYGIALDRQRKHWVSLKPGRKITRWAKSKGIYARAIKVRGYPFINRGYRRMVNYSNIIVNRMADEIVRG